MLFYTYKKPRKYWNQKKYNIYNKNMNQEFYYMQKLAGILTENEYQTKIKLLENQNSNLRNIENELEDAGLNFDDGILGGVGSGGAGYYDNISDKISGFNLDEFNEEEFDSWYDNFSINDFNNIEYKSDGEDDIDYGMIGRIGEGVYAFGDPNQGGFVRILPNGNFKLYASPVLSDNEGNSFPIFSLDDKGDIVVNIDKEELKDKLKQNLTSPEEWAIL